MEQITNLGDYKKLRDLKSEIETVAFDIMNKDTWHVQAGLGYSWGEDNIIVHYLHEGGSQCSAYISIDKILKVLEEKK